MFSGIVEAVGQLESIIPRTAGVKLTIAAGDLDLSDVHIGDSIACNGVCLTVVEVTKHKFVVDASPETIACTTGFENIGTLLNLEKALKLSDRLGGHIVTGHVDGKAQVLAFDAIGDNRQLRLRAPQNLTTYIAKKGSVTINGVSLTVNEVENAEFTVHLIAHTLKNTMLRTLEVGNFVNLEVDLIARYCERLLAEREDAAETTEIEPQNNREKKMTKRQLKKMRR